MQSDICLDLIKNVAGALFVADLLGANSQGIMQAATQQLGLGLMLSTLLISVPPMAGSFFNGVMGGFSAYSVFNSPPRPSSAAGQSAGQSAGMVHEILPAAQIIRDIFEDAHRISLRSDDKFK